MKKESYWKLLVVGIFAIAFALVEAMVVVYIRRIYYPSGFTFPLVRDAIEILSAELAREFATIVMLIAVGYLAGKTLCEKFAYFMYSFAVWDIFYYIWLKVVIGWPFSFFDWDILFLIPWVWIGPVLAPIIVSVSMIVFAFVLIDSGKNVPLKEWIFIIFGWLIVLYTFLIDYGRILFSSGIEGIYSFVPSGFNWALFFIGEFLVFTGIFVYYFRKK